MMRKLGDRRNFAGVADNAYGLAREIIDDIWPANHAKLTRKDWDQCHLAMAWEASKRSPDHQTKVGAFLTNTDHEPVSAGYNGFPRGADDRVMPNVRPDIGAEVTTMSHLYYKYPWMIHAELNTILNAARQGKSTKGTVLYCTHRPCLPCLMSTWQAGCHHVVFDASTSTNMSDNIETETALALFDLVTEGRMILRSVDFEK